LSLGNEQVTQLPDADLWQPAKSHCCHSYKKHINLQITRN